MKRNKSDNLIYNLLIFYTFCCNFAATLKKNAEVF